MHNYNTSAPNTVRPGPRRRETGESNPMSPSGAGSRFFRDETNTSTPPPALLRRKTDFRDSVSNEKGKENAGPESGLDSTSAFGSLKRSSTNPVSAGVTGPSSPWGSASQNASFSPMGAFGAFPMGSNTAQSPSAEKKAGYGSLRGESRFKGLLSKDSSEDIAGSVKDRSSVRNLERLAEDDNDRSQSPWGETVKTRTGRSETNPFDEPRSGSAALGGSQDVEAPSQAADRGFCAFSVSSSIPGFRELMQSEENLPNPNPHLLQGHEPTSPTNTNPYQSPHGERVDADDVDTDGSEIQQAQHPGLSGLRDTSNPFGSMKRVGSGMDLPTVDRSENSSANANRGFSGLGGLGGLSSIGGSSAWPPSGTPNRERPAFAGGFDDPIFGSMADIQSPALGGGGLFSPHAGIGGTGSLGRSSKLGALFNSGMQDDQGTLDSVGVDESSRQIGEIRAPATLQKCSY